MTTWTDRTLTSTDWQDREDRIWATEDLLYLFATEDENFVWEVEYINSTYSDRSITASTYSDRSVTTLNVTDRTADTTTWTDRAA